MLTIKPNFAQERALGLLRSEWKSHGSFMVYAPTGSGKTGLAAFIIDGFVSRGMRVLFVAPYLTLVHQTATRLIQYGLPEDEIGYVWRDYQPHDPERLIQIASADTLIRREFPGNIDLLIVDEAHLRRKKMLETIKYLTEETSVKVIGLSGTPFSAFLGHYYQQLIKPTTIRELMDRGDLSKYEFYAPTTPDLAGVKTASGDYGRDYNEEQLAAIMSGAELVGDIVANWLENGEDLPTICFCVNVAHANFITIKFQQAGVMAEVMTAQTPPEERQLTIHRFEQGATKIIVNVGVLVAGFDSDCRCIIYARPTKSEIRWLQTIGRGLRTAPGKAICKIFDHSGTIHRLGYPDDIEYDELPSKNDGLKDSPRNQQKSKPEKLPRECPHCHYMKPIGVYVCPKCGFKPLVGVDVDTDETRSLKKITGKVKRVYTKAEKSSWWGQIKYYQQQRSAQGKPLSDGWCSHLYKSKFGVWPKDLGNQIIELTPEVANYIRSRNIAYAKSVIKQKGKAA